MALLISRPKLIDILELKYEEAMVQAARSSVTTSIKLPVFMMYLVSLLATPLLMISAFKLGRYRLDMAWANNNTIARIISFQYGFKNFVNKSFI
jgi:Na+-translocating ferredoxin:NAD+ oxidoreductase RnfE subunit